MQMEDEVRDKALKSARERAEKTLNNAGMKIDGIFALSPVAFPEIYQKILAPGQTAGYATTERVVVPDPIRYRLSPITTSKSVHVIYLISPAK